jgi:chaperonin GroEL
MTKIYLDDDTRNRIKMGIDVLANTVKLTLGPGGQNVALKLNGRKPTITKDGVSVARVIELEDIVMNVGAQLVKEVALKTVYTVGDGTTTATVLAQAIYGAGMKAVAAGANPIELKRGIDQAVQAVVKFIATRSKPVEGRDQIRQVASISVNNDEEIGNMIADAMEAVGPDGIVTMDESRTFQTYIKRVEGMQFGNGYMSEHFVTDRNKMICVLENPLILITEYRVNVFQDLVASMEAAFNTGRPLLVIAEDYEAEAMATLVVNKMRGAMQICAVRAPSYGDHRRHMMEDIAILTGGELVSEDNGKKLKDISAEWLGSCERATITKDLTTLLNGQGEKTLIEERKISLKAQTESLPDEIKKHEARERLARISGGIAVIHVGAATETEMREKKDRVEDALFATKAAVAEGIIPGGGITYLHAQEIIEEVKSKLSTDQKMGADIIFQALESPIRTIIENATQGKADGVIAQIRAEKSIHPDQGYNAKLGCYSNMMEAGIIDPAKVARLALENAASIAGLLLSTKAVVIEIEKPQPQVQSFNPNQFM